MPSGLPRPQAQAQAARCRPWCTCSCCLGRVCTSSPARAQPACCAGRVQAAGGAPAGRGRAEATCRPCSRGRWGTLAACRLAGPPAACSPGTAAAAKTRLSDVLVSHCRLSVKLPGTQTHIHRSAGLQRHVWRRARDNDASSVPWLHGVAPKALCAQHTSGWGPQVKLLHRARKPAAMRPSTCKDLWQGPVVWRRHPQPEEVPALVCLLQEGRPRSAGRACVLRSRQAAWQTSKSRYWDRVWTIWWLCSSCTSQAASQGGPTQVGLQKLRAAQA